MKNISKIVTGLTILFVTTFSSVKAQDENSNSEADTIRETSTVHVRSPYGTVVPYDVFVTYNKTTHFIFPSAIRYIDLGNETIVAGKADDAHNVMRVKAAVKDFTEETNISVITEDGKFYNFNIRYSEYPDIFNIDFLKNNLPYNDNNSSGERDVAQLEELGSDSPLLAEKIMETIYRKDKRFIRHIGSESFGIQFLLKGIYTQNGKLYFLLQVRNNTNIPFAVDFINFKVMDKKVSKRTVIQERTVVPLRELQNMEQIQGKTIDRNVYLLEQITIPDDKLLIIELFEKNGGRHQMIKIENSDIIKARLIKEMDLKL